MGLRNMPGRSPKTAKIGKPKIMISGLPAVGKTWFGMSFPNVFHVDVEGGGELAHYQEKLEKANGRYYGREDGSQDFDNVIDVIQWLATNKHTYKTLVIDSFSKLYALAAAKAEEKVGNEYGRDKKEANRPTRKLMTRIDGLDMNVIFVCHCKPLWGIDSKGNRTEIGTTFDGYDKMEYDLHLWIEAVKIGNDRMAVVRKSRLLGFPDRERFDLKYEAFASRYGVDILEAPATPVVLCSAEQAAELERLVKVMNLPTATTEKWFEKAACESYAELPADVCQKCIDWCMAQIEKKEDKPSANGKRKEKDSGVLVSS